MRIGFAEGATSVDALNGWVEPPSPARVRQALSSVGRDEQLGAIFRQMRAVVGLNEAALARKLGTDVSVIMDLEAGIADGLPPWRELAAIVERFAFVAGVDPSPILTRLMQVSSATSARGISVIGRPPVATVSPPPRTSTSPVAPSVIVPVPAPPRVVTMSAARTAQVPPPPAGSLPWQRSTEQSGGRAAAVVPAHKHVKAATSQTAPDAMGGIASTAKPRRRRLGRVGGPVVLLCLLIGGYFAIQHLPRVAYESVGYLPRRLHEPVRNIIDLAVLHTAAVKDGLRWIDVGDPRLRKGDRLKSR